LPKSDANTVSRRLLSLAEMNGIDLQAAVEDKITKNAGRGYVSGQKSGSLIRVTD